jgi:hypothetical protein
MHHFLRLRSWFFGCLLLSSPMAFSAAHFSILGSANKNNLGLSNQDSRSLSFSLAFDISSFLRFGGTHRQTFMSMEGYRHDADTSQYFYVQENTRSIANSVELTIILYYGQMFTPFLQVGIVKKDYHVMSFLGGEIVKARYSQPIVPNGGVGLGVRLYENFSLNLSYSVSPGVRQISPAEKPEGVLDTHTSVGISYQL